MQPIVYVRNAERAATRLAWMVSLVVLACVWGGCWYAFEAELLAFSYTALLSWIFWGLLALLVGSSLLILFFSPVQGLADRLRLDREGVTLARRGRSQHWRWNDIADIEQHGRLHPKALWRGRAIALRPSGRRPHLFIADDYFTPIEEIAARIRSYWELADDRRDDPTRRAGARGSTRVDEPVMIRQRRSSEGVDFGGLAVFLLGTFVVAALSIGLFGWLLDWASLEDEAAEQGYFIIGTIVVILIALPYARFAGSPAWNFMLLSDDGLHVRSVLRGRHWAWHDLSAFELRRVEPRAGTEGKSYRTISFAARHDGDGSRPKTGAAVAGRIDDEYELALEEILPRLNRWRAARQMALRPAREPADPKATTEPPGEFNPAVLTFSSGGEGNAMGLLLVSLFFGLFLLWGGAVMLFFWASPMLADIWLLPGAVGLLVLFVMLSAGLLFAASRVGSNELQLDAEGLLLGRRRRWFWQEVSAFELRPARRRWSSSVQDILTCTAPGGGLLSRYMRWYYNLPADQQSIVIEDTYETPLGEIADKLNEHRRRAIQMTGRQLTSVI